LWGLLGCIEGERGYRVIWGDLGERRHLEELGIDKMSSLKLIFKK
jgi:hypothetical protein